MKTILRTFTLFVLAFSLVFATGCNTSKAVKGEQEPRFWRMRINVQKFGSEAKVTKVDFVP